jgi:hypothetical protein
MLLKAFLIVSSAISIFIKNILFLNRMNFIHFATYFVVFII